ncbi:hypothetical protein CHLRE_05g237283v5 [Chlamydomonas reinhardtii]|uniref:GED domain-containing protein n=1 Tax=Chlamydomonas reinhardtii TaxID=3055 RepID=A0A2K3DSW2_CHLRE|nr:uncharacterized protein CHLRE_05g237283v5 [Chlamydomonas reinhardtii]PNW83625.1 hypothetical protein CHLRE_05g237283v5 [Chlamydomonas reinhardtii]
MAELASLCCLSTAATDHAWPSAPLQHQALPVAPGARLHAAHDRLRQEVRCWRRAGPAGHGRGWKVAFGRVRAAVPMSVRDTLLDRLGDPYEVAAAVQAAVQDISAAAPRLLAEHPHLAARRLWCAERQQRLREALEALHSPAAGVPLHP